MKGLILMPINFKNHLDKTDEFLCRDLVKNMGFKFVFTNDYHPQKIKKEGYDLVLSLKSPQASNPHSMKSLINLDKRIKLICWFNDIHYHPGNKAAYLPRMEAMLARADKVICSFDEGFRSRWGKYLYKYEWFPEFFAPHERYADLPYNENPKMKALLVGAIYLEKNREGSFLWRLLNLLPRQREATYPLRLFVLELKHPYVERLRYSGRRTAGVKTDITGDKYAKKLNEYFCCVTCSSQYKCVVKKYFEIMAAGSLLLADDPAGQLLPHAPGGLRKLGLISGQHYVEINKKNFVFTLEDVIEHPEKYEKVRKTGRKVVLENHSIRNRYQQLKRIIYEMDH